MATHGRESPPCKREGWTAPEAYWSWSASEEESEPHQIKFDPNKGMRKNDYRHPGKIRSGSRKRERWTTPEAWSASEEEIEPELESHQIKFDPNKGMRKNDYRHPGKICSGSRKREMWTAPEAYWSWSASEEEIEPEPESHQIKEREKGGSLLSDDFPFHSVPPGGTQGESSTAPKGYLPEESEPEPEPHQTKFASPSKRYKGIRKNDYRHPGKIRSGSGDYKGWTLYEPTLQGVPKSLPKYVAENGCEEDFAKMQRTFKENRVKWFNEGHFNIWFEGNVSVLTVYMDIRCEYLVCSAMGWAI